MKLQVDKLVLGPTKMGELTLVFTSGENSTLRNFYDLSQLKGRGGMGEMKNFEAESFTTTAYTEDGTKKWEVEGLMTPTVKPVTDGELIYGVRHGALLAVEKDSGKVKWESTDKPLGLPERKSGVETSLVRPWWRTWELRIVGSYVVAWDPDGDQLHSFSKADGTHVGVARFQKLGETQERMLIEDKGKLFYKERGQGTLKELTEKEAANPKGLQAHLTLGANTWSMVEDGTVYEVRQRTLMKKSAPGDKLYYVVSSKADTGQLGWVEMLTSVEPPVINKGKLYRLKTAEMGRMSSVVEAVDPTEGRVKSVDLSGMRISNMTPKMRIMNGGGILLGSQAALRISDMSLAWVNLKLSGSNRAVALGEKTIAVGPMLVQGETGEILGEMEAGEGFRWDEATESAEGDEVMAWGNTLTARGTSVTAQGRVVTFVPEAKRLETTKEERAAAAKREPMSPDKIEEAVWSSRVVPLPGSERWSLQEMVARWKFQATMNQEDAIGYLRERAGQPSRTVDGPFELIKMMRPYALQAANMEAYVQSMEKLDEEFPKSVLANSLKTEIDSAKAEIEKLEQGKKILEGLRGAKPDPSKDWPCARGTASMIGSTGEGVTLTATFKQKWSVKVGNTVDTGSLIMAVGDKVVALVERPGSLKVVEAADGKQLWETGGAMGAACYRGAVFVAGSHVEARDLGSGIVMWRAALTSTLGKHGCAIAAGKDMCVVSTGQELAAYAWDTGKILWRQPLAECDRLEMHGDYVVAGSSTDSWVKFLEAATGKELWSREVDSYAVYDKYLYGLRKERVEQGTQEIRLQRWEIFVDEGKGGVSAAVPLRGAVRRVPSPVVTKDALVIAFGGEVMAVGMNGTVIWKHDLPQYVGADMTVSPTTVFVGLEGGDLFAYDLTKPEGAEVGKFPLMGGAPAAMGNGVLYVLRRGDLVAMEGSAAPYTEDYLKKVREPQKLMAPAAKPTEPETPTTSVVKVKEGQFVKEDCITSVEGLVTAMEKPDTLPTAFEVLLDYGGYDVLKGPAEKYLLPLVETHKGQPVLAEHKDQPFGVEQAIALTNELVERGVPEAVPLLTGAVAGPTPLLAEPVSQGLKDADPTVYAPAILALCKQKAESLEMVMHYPAIRLLGKWGYQPAVPFLASLAENKKLDTPSRLECVQALGMYETGKTSEELLRVMQTKDTDSRLVQAAADMLARGGNPGFNALSTVLGSAAATVDARIIAAGALGKMGSDQACQFLLKTLASSGVPEQLRAECALNAGVTGKESVIETLTKMMNSTTVSTLIRNGCLNGLAATKKRAVVPRIINAIGSSADSRQFRRDAASQLLRSLTGVDLGPDKDKWVEWYNAQKDKPWKTGL